jgi:hypothetical protein
MHRRCIASASFCALLVLFVALRPGVAHAQSRVNEGAARALEKKAMEDDYLNTDFDKAADKLGQAIAKCGTDKCGIPVRAQLKRDLAAVQSAGGHKDAALAAMIDAVRIDAGLQLDPNYKTKELEAIFAEAKKEAKGGGGGGSGGPPPAGDFTHSTVTEQQVRTPIPIYVEYTGSETLKRVMIKYKAVGMTEWKSVELKSIGSGFGANTPCADSQAGDFLYYVQGFNEQNDPVASGGDRQNPYRVNVKGEAMADPPHLPGQSPPSQCAEKGDCPPDFPGCKKGGSDTPTPVADDPSLKGEGDACEEDNECKSGTCKSQKCTAPPEDTSAPKRKKFWIGVAGSLDLTLLSSAKDVCALNLPGNATGAAAGTPVNSAGYYCTQNGADFPTRATTAQAQAIVPGTADSVGGGLSPGNARILLSADYAITANQMAGLRVGYVVNTYTGSQAPHFPPIHLEARYSYVFGDSPIGKAGLHPFILAGAGAAEYDAAVSVAVYETNFTSPNASCSAPTGGKCLASVSAWQTAGPVFLEAGGGARWEFVPGVAGLLDLKLVGAIGGSSGFKFIPTPEAGVQFGF